MFGEVGNFIGQILGIIAVIMAFISFQAKTSRGILIFMVATGALFAAHYFLIGAISGLALNLLTTVMCIIYYFRNKRKSEGKIVPIIFVCLLVFAGILTWVDWRSIFIVAGLGLNAYNLSLSNARTIKKLNFIKAPLCLIYNVLVFSIGGILCEILVMVSSAIALMRARKASVSANDGE
ncbi:MAG: YgjV family protein [Clostridia bacterium]|nr:YgjV family protein [Clostridia bacterium]